jgi:hypothetical protein
MLAHSRTLNPECEHHHGDMRSMRLDRQFDAVFVHDAIMYMTSEADLARAIETAVTHCRPGGVGLFAPDHVRENFTPSTNCGGHDEDLPADASAKMARAMRYLEWSYDPDPDDTTTTTDYTYTLRERDGAVRVVPDRHIEGLFSRNTWLRLLRDAGFDPRVAPFDHSEWSRGDTSCLSASTACKSTFEACRARPPTLARDRMRGWRTEAGRRSNVSIYHREGGLSPPALSTSSDRAAPRRSRSSSTRVASCSCRQGPASRRVLRPRQTARREDRLSAGRSSTR